MLNTQLAYDYFAGRLNSGRKMNRKKIANNTYVEKPWSNREEIYIILHNTAIATLTPTSIVLNTDGWQTVTTKQRMNVIGELAGFYVSQKNYSWSVTIRAEGHTPAQVLPYHDRMLLGYVPAFETVAELKYDAATDTLEHVQ